MPPNPQAERKAHLARVRRLAGYGLTLETYAALLDAQDGHCAVCPATPKGRPLDVDHDHRTGEVRGLLCHTHNRRLWRGATAAELRRMADYLDRTGLDQTPEWRRLLDQINRRPANGIAA